MPAHVIVGAQWGDEGKGRAADLFAAEADIVARYAGGDNAGHTVQVGDDTFKLHLVPSGVLHPHVTCVLGGGMAVNPLKLVEELRELDRRGVDISPARIKLARTAHLITPAHIALDAAKEAQRGDDAIGTTKRGIGPAYTDKVARTGLRTGLMADPGPFGAQLRDHFETSNRLLTVFYDADAVDREASVEQMRAAADFLAPYLVDVPLLLDQALNDDRVVLCEGAQGTLLDIDHGHYPFVTSSNPTVGGAITGLGIGPGHIERVIGIAKAYSTRVGAGPFPTELHGPVADQLRGTGENPWDEYGTTTGRPRRCGWLDAVVLRYAARINGLTELVLTKLDILSGIGELKVADAYHLDGEHLLELPSDRGVLARCQPHYETLPGWEVDIMGVTDDAALPENARLYIQHVEKMVGLPVSTVTVGPARSQTIYR